MTIQTGRELVVKTPGEGRNIAILDGGYDQRYQHYNDDVDEATVIRSTRVVWVFFLLLAVLGTWSYFAEVDEVSTGSGKVVPTSREQVVQSLEGGILAMLSVREGDIVEQGQILAQLDPTKTESNVEESAARYRAALASVGRLTAEVNGTALAFSEELAGYPALVAEETELYHTRQHSLNESLKGINESLKLLNSELAITEALAKAGAASNVEVLRLRRQKAEMELKAVDLRSQYHVRAREELAKVNAEVDALSSVIKGRADALTRLTHRSPVRGIVKDIEVTTIGGVIPPNGRLMEIVPLDEQLLIEARVSPRDIAFIHPGQEGKVKITAYDYNIYGSLDGKVVTISPDTIQDEVKPEVFYYRVFILTESDSLENKIGTQFPIVPGMIATVDIKTGSKTVFDYLVKPFNQAKEALRER
ncbi:HlyD family efflux transporter periplasmic adaptor subunit [Zobellella sp. DQSA1]|uniref:HlyD family efflux transporter periplasmic adaptor subunit n=1 Tax=Zobellella sp. DQSA1 TaxID=3342386 RepID=UPI0035C23E15